MANKDVSLTIRMPEDERVKLKKKAEREGRTMSGVVRSLIAAYLYHGLDPWEHMKRRK